MFGENIDVPALLPFIPEGSVGIELGVWRGITSEKLLTRARCLHVVDAWSVDAYRGPGWDAYLARYADGRSECEMQAQYDQAYEETVLRLFDKPATVYRMGAREFFARGVQADWIYIDASHEYEDVLHDLECSARAGYRIFGDDYGRKPGVTRAVDEFAVARGYAVERKGKQQFMLRGGV